MPDLLRALVTERIVIRAPDLADGPALARRMTPAVARWLRSWPSPMSDSEAVARIAQMQETIAAGGSAQFMLIRRSDGELAGGIGAASPPDAPDRMELSYWLAEDCQGQGLMREALAVVIPALWDLLPAEWLDAGAHPGNAASLGIMRLLNMRPSGERQVYSPVRERDERVLFFSLRRPTDPAGLP